MVLIIFKLDNNDNNNNTSNSDECKITFEYSDTSKSIKEMLIEFVKNNNSYLKLSSKDKINFESTLSPELLAFMCKNKILNKPEHSVKKVSQIFRTNNNVVHIIDTGNILGGKKTKLTNYKKYQLFKRDFHNKYIL